MNKKELNEQWESLLKSGVISGNLRSVRNTNPKKMGLGVTIANEGNTYNVLHLTKDDINIPEMARGLSNQCRYNGHTNYFYSTAQHSVRMAEAALLAYGNPKLALACLCHDLAESLMAMGDIPTPQKKAMPKEFLDEEDRIEKMIFDTLGVGEYHKSKLLKYIDVQICNEEMEVLLNYNNGIKKKVQQLNRYNEGNHEDCSFEAGGIHPNMDAYTFVVDSWTPEVAYERFMSEYVKLTFLIEEYGKKTDYCLVGLHVEDPEKIAEYNKRKTELDLFE